MYFESYRCRKNPAKPKKCHFEASKVATSEMPKTRPSLGEISNCPRWCTEKLKMTPKHTKGVIYTNTNTYCVILKPFKHPWGLKKLILTPKDRGLGIYMFCPFDPLKNLEHMNIISSSALKFWWFSFFKNLSCTSRSRDSFVESQINLIIIIQVWWFPIKSFWAFLFLA